MILALSLGKRTAIGVALKADGLIVGRIAGDRNGRLRCYLGIGVLMLALLLGAITAD